MDSHLKIQLVEAVLLLALSAFFSSAETSLVAVNKIRLRTLAESGNKRAALTLKVLDKENKMLACILIGNNLVNTSLASLASIIATKMGGNAAVAIATFVITFLLLVFGEITPKTLATRHAETLAMGYAPVIWFLMKVLTPVIFVVNLFSNGIVAIFGGKEKTGPSLTESELRTIVEVSHEEGVIESDEKDLIKNVFDFGDARAKDIMVPRVHVVSVEADTGYDELMDLYARERFTRIPVYEDNPDNITGFVNMKDLILVSPDKPFRLKDFMRKPYFTVENKKISDLLMEMKNATNNMAIVLDEYGELAGIVTVEDIIEEIVGEVHDEYDSHEMDNIKKTGDNTWLVKGYLNLHDVNDELDLDLDSEDFDSLGGLMIDALGHLPVLGEQVQLEDGTRLQVVKLDKNRIEEIKITTRKEEKDKEAEENSDKKKETA